MSGSPTERPSKVGLDSDFIPLPFWVNSPQNPLPCSIYIFAHGNMKLAHRAESFLGKERTEAYRDEGIRHFYIRRDDWNDFCTARLFLAGTTVPRQVVAEQRRDLLLLLYGWNCGYSLPTIADKKRFDQLAHILCTRVLSHEVNPWELFVHEGGPDLYFFSHSYNCALIAVLLGQKMHLGPDQLFTLMEGALLHDIGHGFIPHGQDLLSDESLEKHTQLGGAVLKKLGFSSITSLMALEHHERWDGEGYPLQKIEDETHPFSRILAITDRFCDFVCGPLQEQLMTPLEAIKELSLLEGEFDPVLVEKTQKILEECLSGESDTEQQAA
jgi:hypothetical protein